MDAAQAVERLVVALDRYHKRATVPRAVARARLAVRRSAPAMRRAWERWLEAVRRAVPQLVAERGERSAAWRRLEERATAELGAAMAAVFEHNAAHFPMRKHRTDLIASLARFYASRRGAQRIRDITDETRRAVRHIIGHAIAEGLGPAATARLVRQVVGLTERDAARVGAAYTAALASGLNTDQATAIAERLARRAESRRAMTIARTEVNNALRQGIVEMARSTGVALLERVGDPEACPVCVELNARRYTPAEAADEAVANPHPNCECTFVPVAWEPQADQFDKIAQEIGGKAVLTGLPEELLVELREAVVGLTRGMPHGVDIMSFGFTDEFKRYAFAHLWMRHGYEGWMAKGGIIDKNATAIVLNPKYFGDVSTWRRIVKESQRMRWTFDSTVAGLVRHEYGHCIDKLYNLNYQKRWRRIIDHVTKQNPGWMPGMLHPERYEEFYSEAWAECFSAYLGGVKLPRAIAAYFKNVLRRLARMPRG